MLTEQIFNTGYEVLLTGMLAATVAQILKFSLSLIIDRKVDFKLFTTTGGMPSSHTAGVVALSTSVGIIAGYSSIHFAIAAGYAFVVMQDAAGLRRASGKMASCLNKIMDDFYKHDVQAAGGKLKELLGHTPVEVLAGAAFGIIFAYFFHYVILQ